MSPVTFLDTSVLCELVGVPGKSQRGDQVRAEYARRVVAGERFVVPITAVIETGNHIAQASGDRRSAAQRLVGLLTAAAAGEPPFALNEVLWDRTFTHELCQGNATEQSFVDLAGNGLMGGGEVAVLVERDRYVERTSLRRADVGIWTLEQVLGAYA